MAFSVVVIFERRLSGISFAFSLRRLRRLRGSGEAAGQREGNGRATGQRGSGRRQRQGNGGASAGPRRRAPSELFHAVPPAGCGVGEEAFLAFAGRICVCAIY